MKYAKILGLLAVAAAALMAFAASASATTVTSPTGTPYTGKITAVSEPGAIAGTNHVVLTGPLGINVQCNGHVEGEKVESHGKGVTAQGKITAISFTGCTNGYEVTTIPAGSRGSLEVHWDVGTENGTVTSNGTTVLIKIPFIAEDCGYVTENTDVGTITGGKPATFDISAKIRRHSGPAICGTEGTWEGNYKVTVPGELYISE